MEISINDVSYVFDEMTRNNALTARIDIHKNHYNKEKMYLDLFDADGHYVKSILVR